MNRFSKLIPPNGSEEIVVGVFEVVVEVVAYGLLFMEFNCLNISLIPILIPFNGREEIVVGVGVVVEVVLLDVPFVFDFVFLKFNCSNISVITALPNLGLLIRYWSPNGSEEYVLVVLAVAEVVVVKVVVVVNDVGVVKVVVIVNVVGEDVAFGLVFMKGFLIRYWSPNGSEGYVLVLLDVIVVVVNVVGVVFGFGLVFMKGFFIRYLSPNGNEEFIPVVVVVVNFVDVDVGFVFDLVFLEFNCSNISLLLIPPISSEEIVVVVVVELVEVVESVGGSGVLGVAVSICG